MKKRKDQNFSVDEFSGILFFSQKVLIGIEGGNEKSLLNL